MTTDTEIAGNYAVSGGTGDPAYVADKLGEMQDDREAAMGDALDQTATEAEVIHGGDAETITLSVGGDTIECDPIGLGRRARIARQAHRADERGDTTAQLDAVLSMVDALADAARAEEFDRDYFDDLADAELRSAFRDLGQRSAGGERSGK